MVALLWLKWGTILRFNHPASFRSVARSFSNGEKCSYYAQNACDASLLSKWVEVIRLEWKLCNRILISALSYNSWVLCCSAMDYSKYSFIDKRNLIIYVLDQKIFAYEISLPSDNSFLVHQFLSFRVHINLFYQLL